MKRSPGSEKSGCIVVSRDGGNEAAGASRSNVVVNVSGVGAVSCRILPTSTFWPLRGNERLMAPIPATATAAASDGRPRTSTTRQIPAPGEIIVPPLPRVSVLTLVGVCIKILYDILTAEAVSLRAWIVLAFHIFALVLVILGKRRASHILTAVLGGTGTFHAVHTLASLAVGSTEMRHATPAWIIAANAFIAVVLFGAFSRSCRYLF
jgi:hypothetical protein